MSTQAQHTMTVYMIAGDRKVHGRDRCPSLRRKYVTELELDEAAARFALEHDYICKNCGRYIRHFAGDVNA